MSSVTNLAGAARKHAPLGGPAFALLFSECSVSACWLFYTFFLAGISNRPSIVFPVAWHALLYVILLFCREVLNARGAASEAPELDPVMGPLRRDLGSS